MSSSFEHWLLESNSLPDARSMVVPDSLGKAMSVVALSERAARPILVVASTRGEARNLVDNIRFFLRRPDSVHYLPETEFDYYRGLLLNPELLCERNVALHEALNAESSKEIFVTTVAAVLQKAVPPERFRHSAIDLATNGEIERDRFIKSLISAGYQRQPTAYDPGIFSVRGGVIDIFCPLYPRPIRLEFYGDLIDEIRFFDPKTQLSQEKIDSASILPVGISLLPLDAEFAAAFDRIKQRLDELGVPKVRRDEIIEGLRSGVLQPEHSFLFPYLSGGSAPLLDYFPESTIVIWDGQDRLRTQAHEIEIPKLRKSHELYEKDPLPITEYGALFLGEEDLKAAMSGENVRFWEAFSSSDNEMVLESDEMIAPPPAKSATAVIDSFALKFKDWIDQGYRVHLVSHTDMHATRACSLFELRGVSCERMNSETVSLDKFLKADFSKLHVWQGFVSESRIYPKLKVAIVSEENIFGHKKRAARSSAWSTSDSSRLLSSFRDMQVGDYVVHKEFGIGKYLGLKVMNFQEVENEYVQLEYKDGDKLYIPVYRLNVLQKYVGGEGATANLDKLGGDGWSKAKAKARKAAQELAAEFLKLHAKRRMIPAYKFSEPGLDYQQFEMAFPFDETPDQMKAIEDVQADLGRTFPMDRLLCGDVGYGKTEVAMRAAFRAVQDGKQVAVLVPTTVLAFQHFENFKKRFEKTAAVIEMVSRLKSPKEVKATLERVKAGKVDVLIGTHRLLSSDIEFKDLSLLIVDEEHRFGVVHKEKLKKMSESIHVLSMTATPIPRTLNMAMTGIKEISIITTPPPDRLSVRTFVCRKSDEILVQAIQNELAREGQIFFVHNRIETIFGIADELRELFPKLKFEIVHGQMDGEALERKMLAFYRGEAEVLLTTTIIESGLDIPRANTIIIDRADHFGLAQLYQLRGRVGRAERRAYCYLLVPNENEMSADAKQRLQVIQRYSDLGGGFQVASHDLEIRGAGDLLGKEQSGHLNAVGIDMYFDLLDEAIRELKGQPALIEIEPEINLKISANFPTEYLPDIGERIQLYRRLSSVESVENISEIETEIRDRFGNPPEEVSNLIGLMTLKHSLKQLHVVRMSAGPKRTSLQFANSTPASPEKLVKLIAKDPKNYQITPDQKFVFSPANNDWKTLLHEIQRLCDSLEIPIP